MTNKDDFRNNVLFALRAGEVYLKQRGRTRDRREPGRLEKLRHEQEIVAVLDKVFSRQQRAVVRQVRERYAANRKIMDIAPGVILDDNWDDSEIAELIRILIQAVKGGVALFGREIGVDIDYSLVNVDAIRFVKDYVYNLVRGVNNATVKLLRNAVTTFVETPGFRIGDVVELLNPVFGTDRSLRIAVTEITRAYAEGNLMAGKELRREYPDVKMVKIWYTNNDDKVCEICEPLNGMKVEIDEGFTTEDDKSIGLDGPPAHPNCRCWMITTTDIRGTP